MKFLCVPCNTQMKLIKTPSSVTPNDTGSLTIRYECPECLTEMAMLTNSFETQLVTSLGVEIGGSTVKGPEGAQATPEGKCPFPHEARKTLADVGLKEGAEDSGIQWTAQALVRLKNIPEFVRPMAKQGIEQFAKDQGYSQVDEKALDEAKKEFNM